MGRPFFYSEWNRMGRNGTERNVMIKKQNKWERNDLAEGPCSRTERNDLKKSEHAQPSRGIVRIHRFTCLLDSRSLKHDDGRWYCWVKEGGSQNEMFDQGRFPWSEGDLFLSSLVFKSSSFQVFLFPEVFSNSLQIHILLHWNGSIEYLNVNKVIYYKYAYYLRIMR